MIPPCVICGQSTPTEMAHDNHDPRPLLNFGRCCGWCNKSLVLPARQREWFDKRAAMVRLVVAQQWAVAMCLLTPKTVVNLKTGETHQVWQVWQPVSRARIDDLDALAGLPCADDVVAEALGER